MCTVISCVIGRGYLLWPVCSLGKTLLAFPCFILYSKAKLACYSGYLLTSCFCIPIPYDKKDIFLVLVIESVVDLHRTSQLQLPRQIIQHHSNPSLCPNYWCQRSWSWLVLWRPTKPSRTNTKERYPFHYRELECKSRKLRDIWSNRQVWPLEYKTLLAFALLHFVL